MIYEFGFNQDYYTFTQISLIRIVLCSEFHQTKIIDDKCFGMKSTPRTGRLSREEYLCLGAKMALTSILSLQVEF